MFASNQNVTMTNQKCKIYTQRNDRRSILSSDFHKSGIFFFQEVLQCVLQMQFNWKNKIMRILLTQNILTICLFLDILTNQIKRKTLKSGFQFTLIQYSFKILQLIKCIKTVRPIRRC